MGATSNTNGWTGTITFNPSAFMQGNTAQRELTATLMHELNDVSAGLLSGYYDSASFGGRDQRVHTQPNTRLTVLMIDSVGNAYGK